MQYICPHCGEVIRDPLPLKEDFLDPPPEQGKTFSIGPALPDGHYSSTTRTPEPKYAKGPNDGKS